MAHGNRSLAPLIAALVLGPAFGWGTLRGQDRSWSAPYPAHKVAGNVYYVGTAELACFLVTTPEGHILINSGLADSTPLIRSAAEKLGFQLKDVRILLTMQAHYDHVAAFAEIRKLSGAQVYVTTADAPLVESGGKADTYLGHKNPFTPVPVDRRLKDGDVVKLGGTELKVILTPGHTPGSVSYSTEVNEGGKRYRLLFANMGTVVMPLRGNTMYPAIADDFRRSFAVQKALEPDIWVAAHASQYDLDRKHKAGSFVDPEGYKQAVRRYEKAFEEQLRREQGSH